MTGENCVVFNCISSTNGNKNLRFFGFPSNIPRCRLWVKATGRKDLQHLNARDILKKYIICEKHFKPTDFDNGKLKRIAVPTLHLKDKNEPPRRNPPRRESVMDPTPTQNEARFRTVVRKTLPPKDMANPGPSQRTTRRSARKRLQNDAKADKTPNKTEETKKQK